MQLVHGLPALMQLVQDADDELAALTGSCRWAREHAGADRVAIVNAESTALVVSADWTAADLRNAALSRALQGAVPVTIADPPWVIVSAPVRHARVVIGRVVARAKEEAGATLEQAVVTVAALIAPALRTRLDAQALVRDAHIRAPEILGGSLAMTAIREAVARAAATTFPVLIEGESGTGKELVARALHRLSPRRDRSFQAINCAALTDELVEAELFGHARGAFTGAIGTRVGLFEQAHGGTLFLDEVSEMGLGCQAKLLRAIERREFRRVGGTRKIKVNLRVVAASNVSLEDSVAAHRFRPDLYYRLKVLSLRVPPLRERREVIPVLAQRLLDEVARNAHVPPKRLTTEATAQLERYDWPGNVRELRNVMESAALIGPKGTIAVEDLPANVRGVEAGVIQVAVGTRLDEVERKVIQRTLDSYPTVKETARVLGIGLRTLHSKIRRYRLRSRRS
jgi:DNA-binding NtrC family response regulator